MEICLSTSGFLAVNDLLVCKSSNAVKQITVELADTYRLIFVMAYKPNCADSAQAATEEE